MGGGVHIGRAGNHPHPLGRHAGARSHHVLEPALHGAVVARCAGGAEVAGDHDSVEGHPGGRDGVHQGAPALVLVPRCAGAEPQVGQVEQAHLAVAGWIVDRRERHARPLRGGDQHGEHLDEQGVVGANLGGVPVQGAESLQVGGLGASLVCGRGLQVRPHGAVHVERPVHRDGEVRLPLGVGDLAGPGGEVGPVLEQGGVALEHVAHGGLCRPGPRVVPHEVDHGVALGDVRLERLQGGASGRAEVVLDL